MFCPPYLARDWANRSSASFSIFWPDRTFGCFFQFGINTDGWEKLKKTEGVDFMKDKSNQELKDLGTHMAGATDLHKTRTTNKPVQIDPPAVSTTGITGERRDDE